MNKIQCEERDTLLLPLLDVLAALLGFIDDGTKASDLLADAYNEAAAIMVDGDFRHVGIVYADLAEMDTPKCKYRYLVPHLTMMAHNIFKELKRRHYFGPNKQCVQS